MRVAFPLRSVIPLKPRETPFGLMTVAFTLVFSTGMFAWSLTARFTFKPLFWATWVALKVAISFKVRCTGAGCVTVTCTEALIPEPSVACAVMVALPAATALTLPESSTVATALSLEVHFNTLLVAFSGVMVACTVSLEPTCSDSCEGLSRIPSTRVSSPGFGVLPAGTVMAFKLTFELARNRVKSPQELPS